MQKPSGEKLMFADLHIHTYFSDGTQSPQEVVNIAKERDLSLISVCDHNTIAAYEELPAACKKAGIRLLQGVELDVAWQDQNLHILAYGFDPKNSEFIAMMEHNHEQLEQISIEVIKKMTADYPAVNLSDYGKYRHKLGAGGWRGLNYLIGKGVATDLASGLHFYHKYGGYKADFYSLNKACQVIKNAGGLPILAHPCNWWPEPSDDFCAALSQLITEGITGIECYYPANSEALAAACLKFCREHGLAITCGGDGHGSFDHIGTGAEYDIGIMKIDIAHLNLDNLTFLA
jgi:predicted metal-dependent phosphoesterase TrpH